MAFFDLLEREAEPWKDPVEVPTATGAHHRVGWSEQAVEAVAPSWELGATGVGRRGFEPLTSWVSSSDAGSRTVHPGPRNRP